MATERDSILMVAGEASGDLHGSKVVRRILETAPATLVYGVAGDRMVDAGMEPAFRSDDFSMVGFVEVVRHVPRLRRAMDELVRLAVERRTRVAVLIDYPGFNLILARRLKTAGVRVLYYISPQVWAWGEGRVRRIAERVDRMAVILPFEVEFYRDRGLDVEFVGHPLMEEPWVAEVEGPKAGLGDPLVLGLLPGSRRQEISRHLGVMLRAARLLLAEVPGLAVRLGLARGLDRSWLESIGGADLDGIALVDPERVHDLMAASTALIVASGTATLEAACAGTPMVITYRTSPASYALARSMVRIPHIGLVNVIAGEEVVPEVLQSEARPRRLADVVTPFLTDGDLVARTSRRLFDVRSALGGPGASDRVARLALSMMEAAR